MHRGQRVTLESTHGPIERVVVEDLGDVLLICRERELHDADAEDREPVAVGFRRSAVLAEEQ